MRLDRAGFAQHLAALYVFALGAAQQDADVVTRLTLIKQLSEHFHASAGGLLGVSDADDLDFFANLDDAALNTASHHGAATRDREDVFDGHQEGAINGALGQWDVAVKGIHEFVDGAFAHFAFVAFHGEFG